MLRKMEANLKSNILAVVYTDGIAADKFLAGWGYALRAAGKKFIGGNSIRIDDGQNI